MSFTSIGDLAHNFQTRRQTSAVKSELNMLSYELASGKRQKLSESNARDFASFVGLERNLTTIGAFEVVAKETSNLAGTMQTSLGMIESLGQGNATTLIDAATIGNAGDIDAASAEAGSRFESVLAALNTRSAGRYLFSGQAWDTPALADAPTIMSALTSIVAGLNDAASVEAAIDAWFDTPGGGYETVAYTGSSNTASVYQIAEGESVSISTSALTPEIRGVVKAHAKAALLETGLLSAFPGERAAFADLAGRDMMGQQPGLILERAKLGATEARIALVQETQATTKSALEMMRASIVEADPFETASRLEATRTQLETIYTVTARLSQLSLSNYLR